MKKSYLFLTAIYLLVIATGLKAQTIPANRRVDWSVAGYQGTKPVYTTIRNITDFFIAGDGTTVDQQLDRAILSLDGGNGVIYFPAGTYVFGSPIVLRSGIVLRGQGASSTTLQFNLGGSGNLITIAGNNTSDISGVNGAAVKNQNTISVSNPSLFRVNDYVKIYQNDTSLLRDAYAWNSVAQVLRIESISGNNITFNHPLRRTYQPIDSPRLRRLQMTTGVGIECLKIQRLDSSVGQTSNIYLDKAAQCWINGVESDSCNFAHVQIANSTNIEVTGSYFHGAFRYGGGGQGYGISAEYSSGECLIENNIFRHLRHSMLVQSGANGNVFTYNYSREPFASDVFPSNLAGDIVMHGNYPYASLFEGNIVQNIVVDSSHRINGPFNTLFRNRAQLYGILFNALAGDSTNVVGNEVTAAFIGQDTLTGNGNLEYGTNIRGTIKPVGTSTLPESSYYYSSTPAFWNVASSWPPIGVPNTVNSGTIPALQRFNSGSGFTVCSSSGVLPIQLFSSSVKKTNGKNLVQWQTDNSNDVARFEVERSGDAVNFIKVGELNPSTGTGNIITYEFSDAAPLAGANYYRIHIIEKSGNSSYSRVMKVNNDLIVNSTIYPNPVKDRLHIVFDGVTADWQVTIRNNSGQAVLSKKFILTGTNTLGMNVESLAKGVYFVELLNVQTGTRSVHRFIKE